jgi:hypothetical protein
MPPKRTLELCRGDFLQKRGQVALLLQQDRRKGQRVRASPEPLGAVDNLVTQGDDREALGCFEFQIPASSLFRSFNDRLQLGEEVAEVLGVAEDLLQSHYLVLQLAGLLKGGEVLVRMGNRLAAVNNRARLFDGEREVAVLFEELFGAIPPALELTLGEESRHQQAGELVLSAFVAVVGQDGCRESHRIGICLGSDRWGVQTQSSRGCGLLQRGRATRRRTPTASRGPAFEVKSIRTWLSRKSTAAILPKPQLLWVTQAPSTSCSKVATADVGILPASTAF